MPTSVYGCLTFIPISVKASITSARFSADQPLYWFRHGPTGRKALLQMGLFLFISRKESQRENQAI